MKILILIPHPNARGGITNYYQTIKDYLSGDVDYFFRGAKEWPYRKSAIYEILRIIRDNWLFTLKIIGNKYQLLQTTTSFSLNAVIRDAIFILIAKIFGLKIIVFYRGWDEHFIRRIRENRLLFWLFKTIYFKADAIIDLVQSNIDRLKKWGYQKPIYLESTLVDDSLIESISLHSIIDKYSNESTHFNILYLGRIEKTKGVYESIDAFHILQRTNSNISFILAGDGKEMDTLREYVASKQIQNIQFKGFVSGAEKVECFRKAHIYIFPSHFEGMPTSVLEAMAFGLPVVTRNVGGLADFFENGINGYITDSQQPEVFANLMERLINDRKIMHTMAKTNYCLAQDRFLASKVAGRLNRIFEGVLKN